MSPQSRKTGKPPDAASLREAALAHLDRFAATEAGLARVLVRRIDRWVRAAEAEGIDAEAVAAAARNARGAVQGVIAGLRELGAVDDAAFAASRARRLVRAGKSRRAAIAHLAGKGVDQDIAADLLPEDGARDLAAASAYLRRRRLPPFGTGDPTRAIAALARGGFDREIAERAVRLDAGEAEAMIIALRRDERR